MFADNLKDALKATKTKPSKLAAMTGVTPATAYSYVREKDPVSPKVDWVYRAADALGISDYELICRAVETIPEEPAATAPETALSDGETPAHCSDS